MNQHTINLDKERILIFSNRAFRELEKRTGKSIFGMFADSSQGTEEQRFQKLTSLFFSIDFITGFIWAGLLHEKITYEAVEEMILPTMYKEIMPQCLNIALVEMGFMDKSEKKNIEVSPSPSLGTN